jgi:DNA repair exonuclease SbcCD ATPase subunit
MSTPQAIPNGAAPHAAGDAASTDLRDVEDRLQEEMRRLAAINQELLGKAPPAEPQEPGKEAPDELGQLRKENAQLQARVEELEQALQAGTPNEEIWLERQKEYETLLEEKSEVIRNLHLRIQEQGGGGDASVSTASDGDVLSLKKQLEEQRRQLEEDEEALMQQMRQMEMAMSKDRAELARQRNEIQRLHSELNHEIENASRDPALRERLVALQRLQGEMTGRKPTATIQPASKAPSQSAPLTHAEAALDKRKNSGLLSRIFGK